MNNTNNPQDDTRLEKGPNRSVDNTSLNSQNPTISRHLEEEEERIKRVKTSRDRSLSADQNEGFIVAGKYRLLSELGTGGMGEVWLAEQLHPVKRQVALKLIKAGVGSKEIISRFDTERQSLALMNHPNIARIMDGGATDDGRPYFVMELVSGTPLTSFCDANCLSINERLELIVDVCSGVQHAHQKGIIHRDLKPGNILVGTEDGQPVPKIIDFGLAKAMESTQRLTDHSSYTGIGQILGTYKYMSPEQASLDNLDIDTRTDIYSLGVILYELMTGSTPLDDASIKGWADLKVLEFIRETEPVKPSSKLSSSTDEQISAIIGTRQTDSIRLKRILAGDLDWIVMQALEKDRTRRYESASGFGADIRRYLNNEPVIARPPSLNYRVRKFVRKNRVGVVAASLVLLALTGGILGTTLGMFRAIRAEGIAETRLDQANQARAGEEEQRKFAETRRQEAEQNLKYAKKGNEILGSVFAGLDPKAEYYTVAELRNGLRDNLTIAIDELGTSAIGDPLAVADIQMILGESLFGLGEFQQAIPLFERARKTRAAKLGPDHPDTLTSMNQLAVGYGAAGQLDKSLPLLEETLAIRKSKLGPDHLDTLTSMNSLTLGYRDTGQLEKALPLLEETLSLARNKLGPDDMYTVTSMNNLAMGYLAMGQTGKALPLLEETLVQRKKTLGPDRPETLIVMNNLASVYRNAGHLDKALLLFEETLKLRKSNLGADHPETLTVMNNLASAYEAAGQLDKSLPMFVEILELRRRRLGPDHPHTLQSMSNLAAAYHIAGQLDQALPLNEEALALRKIKLGPDHPDTLTSMINVAAGYRDTGQPEKALPMFVTALALIKSELGPDHPNTLICMNNLAVAYLVAGQLDKAFPLVEETLTLWRIRLGPDQLQLASILISISRDYLRVGHTKRASELLEEGFAIRKRLAPDAWNTFNAQSLLGGALLAQSADSENDKEKTEILAEAKTLLVEGYEGIKAREATIPLKAADSIPESLDRLIELYTALDKPDEVTKYRELRGEYPASKTDDK